MLVPSVFMVEFQSDLVENNLLLIVIFLQIWQSILLSRLACSFIIQSLIEYHKYTNGNNGSTKVFKEIKLLHHYFQQCNEWIQILNKYISQDLKCEGSILWKHCSYPKFDFLSPQTVFCQHPKNKSSDSFICCVQQASTLFPIYE